MRSTHQARPWYVDRERPGATELLVSCDHLNDRDAVLARLDQR